jgi:hypothetical protein
LRLFRSHFRRFVRPCRSARHHTLAKETLAPLVTSPISSVCPAAPVRSARSSGFGPCSGLPARLVVGRTVPCRSAARALESGCRVARLAARTRAMSPTRQRVRSVSGRLCSWPAERRRISKHDGWPAFHAVSCIYVEALLDVRFALVWASNVIQDPAPVRFNSGRHQAITLSPFGASIRPLTLRWSP